MSPWLEVSGVVASTSAALAGLIYIAKQAQSGWRHLKNLSLKIERLFDIASHELENNSGTSMKDKVDATHKRIEATHSEIVLVKEEVNGLCNAVERGAEHRAHLDERITRLEHDCG